MCTYPFADSFKKDSCPLPYAPAVRVLRGTTRNYAKLRRTPRYVRCNCSRKSAESRVVPGWAAGFSEAINGHVDVN